MQKVAVAWYFASKAKTPGVYAGLGPSSNVSATTRPV